MSQTQRTNYRWTVVVLLFFATTINYLDRQVIGFLKPDLQKEFHWSESDYGFIVIAFQAAYAFGLLLFGAFIDRLNTKQGYTISIIVWSLAGVLNGVVNNTFGFLVVRMILGVGEGGNFPAAIKAIAEWFPKKERAFATGIFNSGANIGAVVAPILVPWILGVYDWQMAFIITGAIGFIWLIFWWIYYEIPSRHKKINSDELEYINSDAEEEAAESKLATEKIAWSRLFTVRQTWALVVGKFLTDPMWYFFLFWLPSYFSSTFNLDLKKPTLPLILIYTATTIGSIGGGYLSSWFIKRGMPVFKARKTAMFIFALCVVPIFTARYATNIWQSVALIGLAAAAHQAWSANIYTTASDIFPKKAVSSIIGIAGMAGSVGAILFPFFIGWVLDSARAAGNVTAGYNILFTICACAYVAAWLLMHLLMPKRKAVNL
ncbi:MFS transporter [Mucilaginibacter sp. MD40]|uniref:MFS transporter n=1 Tax=Mucilaginibacter sp. MD40 TaxID=2029590 RepID=UPI000BAC7CD3|nr:MFS transporter [Mucilaginibacter sp. MD40]PAW93865.1 MFS transporter [Mucilaginibacter sp. MD40]